MCIHVGAQEDIVWSSQTHSNTLYTDTITNCARALLPYSVQVSRRESNGPISSPANTHTHTHTYTPHGFVESAHPLSSPPKTHESTQKHDMNALRAGAEQRASQKCGPRSLCAFRGLLAKPIAPLAIYNVPIFICGSTRLYSGKCIICDNIFLVVDKLQLFPTVCCDNATIRRSLRD